MFIIYESEDLTCVKRKILIEPDTIIQLNDRRFPPRFTIILKNNEKLTFSDQDVEIIHRFVLVLRSMTYSTPNMSINDFEIISVIGRGAFGKVLLCKYKANNEYYAIKVIKKSALVSGGQVKKLLTERNLLHKLKHPFIVSLKFAFKNAGKVYLGMEYASGGELYHLMMKRSRLPEDEVKLIIASIALALDYLHKNGVIYRDIKPENVVFDAQGYAKLTDFGLSKETFGNEDTNTFCGTAEYLAPEIIMGKSYDYAVDWWALGVMTFELLYGTLPYNSPNKNTLYNSIINEEPVFPPEANNQSVMLIKSLLKKDPTLRATLEQVQSSPFFEDIDFNDLYERKIKPKYVPPLPADRTQVNFDSVFTNENPLDSLATPILAEIPEFDGFTFYPDPKQPFDVYKVDDIEAPISIPGS